VGIVLTPFDADSNKTLMDHEDAPNALRLQ
jgi:hypothetical protein